MLRLKDVPEEKLSEVMRIASELQRRDEAELDRERKSRELSTAAEEVGIPAEYLEKAAAEWHSRQVAVVEDQRRKRSLALPIAAGLAVGVGLVAVPMVSYQSARVPAPPVPVVQTTPPMVATRPGPAGPRMLDNFTTGGSGRWTLAANPGTQATVTYTADGARGQVPTIRVDRFVEQAGGGGHRANYDLPLLDTPLTGAREIAFDARGSGLPNIRVYLENGALERWRSPQLPVQDGWRTHRVPIERFEYQTRPSSNARWRVERFRRPDQAQRLSFKLGDFINPPTARGQVSVDDVRVE